VLPPSKKLRQIATTSNAKRSNDIKQRYKKQEYFIIFIFYVNLRQTSSL